MTLLSHVSLVPIDRNSKVKQDEGSLHGKELCPETASTFITNTNMRIILTIILALITSSIHIESASAKELYSNHPYNVPPRILSYCEQGYIGYEYSPIKERRCAKLWGMFTREYLLEESEYFSNL